MKRGLSRVTKIGGWVVLLGSYLGSRKFGWNESLVPFLIQDNEFSDSEFSVPILVISWK
jgi:hypothetical protein